MECTSGRLEEMIGKMAEVARSQLLNDRSVIRAQLSEELLDKLS